MFEKNHNFNPIILHAVKYSPTFYMLMPCSFLWPQLGEGLVVETSEKAVSQEVIENTEPQQRPESVTSGELSLPATLEAAASNNLDQSPARSPHARSWTVPGLYVELLQNHLLLIRAHY